MTPLCHFLNDTYEHLPCLYPYLVCYFSFTYAYRMVTGLWLASKRKIYSVDATLVSPISSSCTHYIFSRYFSQQRIALLLEILSFIVRFCALMIGIWQQNFYLAIAYYCVASALIILVQLLWYWHLVKQYEIKRI